MDAIVVQLELLKSAASHSRFHRAAVDKWLRRVGGGGVRYRHEGRGEPFGQRPDVVGVGRELDEGGQRRQLVEGGEVVDVQPELAQVRQTGQPAERCKAIVPACQI